MLAFDKTTNRRIDENGFLHVSVSHISKETVNPYIGREIPGWQELNLDPDKIYNCYRKGSELKTGAESFNGLPILWGHKAESAETPNLKDRVGSMGTDATFKAPYLDNSLIFTNKKAIDAIESGERVELSCSYRWTPVIKAGEFNGAIYDIIMTEIRGNHLGLVEEGRAGSDVLVHDSKPEAVMANDTDPELEKKENVLIKKMQDIVEEFKQIHKKEEKVMEKEGKAMDSEGMKEAFGKMSKDEQQKALDGFAEMMKAKKEDKAEDEEKEEVEEAEDGCDQEEEKAEDQEEEKKKDEKAMDVAMIRRLAKDEAMKEITAHHKALTAAAADVRSVIGNIDALSFDSANDIYGKALELQKISTKGFDPSSYKGMFSVLKTNKSTKAPLAMDTKNTELSGCFSGLKNTKIS